MNQPISPPPAVPGLAELTTSKRVVPKLLRLTWDGYPLHYDRRFGWGYVVPGRPDDPGEPWAVSPAADAGDGDGGASSDADGEDGWEEEDSGRLAGARPVLQASEEDGDLEGEGGAFPLPALLSVCAAREDRPMPESDALPIPDVQLRGASFFPLPHRDGLGNNVGNPLSKHFLTQAEAGVLRAAAGAGSSAERVLRVSQTISYWRNNQERIVSQRAVLAPRDEQPPAVTESPEYDGDQLYGAILPQVGAGGGRGEGR